MSSNPEVVVDVHPDGDVILILSNLAGVNKPIGLRVSSYALRFSSPVFEEILSQCITPTLNGTKQETKVTLLEDDGDTLFLLCTALHLHNRALPHRVSSDQLHKFALAAAKYQCVAAAGRATTMWFDYIYNHSRSLPPLIMIEAAYLLDDPVYFSRFTSRWILHSAHTDSPASENDEVVVVGDINPDMESYSPSFQNLVSKLLARRTEAALELRADVDHLVDPCAQCLAEENKHYVDIPPTDPDLGDEYVSDDDIREPCDWDKWGAQLILGALRDDAIWPATRWPRSLRGVIDAVTGFAVPEYDARDKCCFCDDVVARFGTALDRVRAHHRTRLWGLCLDCVGGPLGTNAKTGGCRVEHDESKAGGLSVLIAPLQSREHQGLLTPGSSVVQTLMTPITPTVSVETLDEE